MSVVSGVGFLWSGLILEVLKDGGVRPEVRVELMRVTAWSREEGIGSREQVVAWLDATILSNFRRREE
jgi:hypothetical protein